MVNPVIKGKSSASVNEDASVSINGFTVSNNKGRNGGRIEISKYASQNNKIQNEINKGHL